MAWDKTKCAEGILAPDFNDEVREQYVDLEAALTKEMNFSTGGTESLQGILKQGGARCFFQATAPATRVDGSAFASTDNGSLWGDSDNNKVYILTDYSGPTWTSIESVTIATLLAATRTFAEIITFTKAAVFSVSPTFTEGIVANNSYLQGRNEADDGNVDLIKSGRNVADDTDVAVLPDETRMATNAAPGEDTDIANKKYVDDALGQSSQATGTSDISNTTGNWADMANMSITITTKGGNVLLMFSGVIKTSTSGYGHVRFDVDGTPHHDTFVHNQSGSVADHDSIGMQWLETSLAAGSHTFKVQWKDSSGTIYQEGAGTPRIFTAIELPS